MRTPSWSRKDFADYVLLAAREDRSRLWKLGVVVLVAVCFIGVEYTGSESPVRAPLYAIIAATALAAQQMPIKPLSQLSTANERQREYLVRVDLGAPAVLGGVAGGGALLAALYWLASAQPAQPYFIAGTFVAIVGAVTLLRTFIKGLEQIRDDDANDGGTNEEGEQDIDGDLEPPPVKPTYNLLVRLVRWHIRCLARLHGRLRR